MTSLTITNDGVYFSIATFLTFFVAVICIEVGRRIHMRYVIRRDRLHRDNYRIRDMKEKEK